MRPRRNDNEPSLGPSTFAELYARHQQGLLAFFMRRTFDAEASFDLVGETFAQVFTSRRRFRGTTTDAEAALLYTVARRLLGRYYENGRAERDALRRLGVRAALDDESIARIEELAGVATMRALMAEQLRGLSDEHREALELRVVDELGYPEIAARLGVSEPTARARVSRALRPAPRVHPNANGAGMSEIPAMDRLGEELESALRELAPRRSRLLGWLHLRASAGRPRRRVRGRGVAIALAALVVAGSASAAVVHFGPGLVHSLAGSGGGGAAEKLGPNSPDCTPAMARSAHCPQNTTFDPNAYVGHNDVIFCSVFASQADAQAVLRADPSDPSHLDGEDRDGIACPQLLGKGPEDRVPVRAIAAAFRCRPSDSRSARCPQPWRSFDVRHFVRFAAVDEYDCDAFVSQADAQAVLRVEPSDPNRLESATSGIACPDLPAPKDLAPVNPGLRP